MTLRDFQRSPPARVSGLGASWPFPQASREKAKGVRYNSPVLRARACENVADLRAMQEVVSASWRVEKPLVRFHVGDLAWAYYQHTRRQREWRIRLWKTLDGEPVGWAWLRLPNDAELHIRPDLRRDLIPEIVEWLAAEASTQLRVSVLDRDDFTVNALLAEGFEQTREGVFNAMVRELDDDLPEPVLSDGFRARHVEGEADLADRVAVHRAAWSVFGPSRLTEASYRNVMSAWPYRRELDWVVEAPDGRFVSSCLVWLDEENRVGELEPVGTDPAFWRRGFGFAACAAGLRALREHGADTAVVYSTDVPGKPSAPALYRALGFETRGHHVSYTRAL
jgi:ribosomal protein S18 acetylase RimI-like enzyme